MQRLKQPTREPCAGLLLALLVAAHVAAGCSFADGTVGRLRSDQGAGLDTGVLDADAPRDADARSDADGATDAGGIVDAGPLECDGGACDQGVPITLLVTNTGDSGAGSLRAALLQANASGAPAVVAFAIPNDDPGHLYYADDAAPGVSSPTTTTLADASINDFDADYPNTTERSWWRIALQSPLPPVGRVVIDGATQRAFAGIGANVPVVAIDGGSLPAAGAAPGLDVACGSEVNGLVLGGFPSTALRLSSGSGGRVEEVFVGVDPSGLLRHPNGGAGVLGEDCDDLSVGRFSVLSSNAIGLHLLRSDRAQVSGAFVGSMPGTAFPDLGNVSHGIWLDDASDTRVDDTLSAFNGGAGVFVSAGSGNVFAVNGLIANAGLDIDLAPEGPDVADPLDADQGPNGSQNAPVVAAYLPGAGVAGEDVVRVMVSAAADTAYTLELQYTTGTSTLGTPQWMLRSRAVMTDAAGAASVDVPVTFVPADSRFAASLTGPDGTGERGILQRVP